MQIGKKTSGLPLYYLTIYGKWDSKNNFFCSLCFTEDVIAVCQKLGVTRSFLSLANLDRMAKRMPNDETFKQLPVIDGDHLLWVSNLFLPRFSVKTNEE